MALQGNGLPRWPLANQDTGVMLGASVNIVVSEAIQKGLTDFNEDQSFFAADAMLERSTLNFGAPPQLSLYHQLGFSG